MSDTVHAAAPADAPAGSPPDGGAELVAARSRRKTNAVKGLVAVLALVLLFSAPFAINTYLLFVLNLTLVYAIATLGFNLLVGWSGQIGLAHAALFAVGAYGSAIAMEHGSTPAQADERGEACAALFTEVLAETSSHAHAIVAAVTRARLT